MASLDPIWGEIPGHAYTEPQFGAPLPQPGDVVVRLESSPELDAIGGGLDLTFGFRTHYGDGTAAEVFGLVGVTLYRFTGVLSAPDLASLRSGPLTELVEDARQRVEMRCRMERFYRSEDARVQDFRKRLWKLHWEFLDQQNPSAPDPGFLDDVRVLLTIGAQVSVPVDLTELLAKTLKVESKVIRTWTRMRQPRP